MNIFIVWLFCGYFGGSLLNWTVLRRWFCWCWLFVYCYSHCGSLVIVLCFVVRYFMSILVLQSSWWGRESWLLCLICLPVVSWWLSGSSSRCHGVVCSLWLWYFLVILTYYFCVISKIICFRVFVMFSNCKLNENNRTINLHMKSILSVSYLIATHTTTVIKQESCCIIDMDRY